MIGRAGVPNRQQTDSTNFQKTYSSKGLTKDKQWDYHSDSVDRPAQGFE
jgi:hypothetical protein